MDTHTSAPWSNDQVDSINAYQQNGAGHPLTCGNCRAILIATPDALKCYTCGNWSQTQVHTWIANWRWKILSKL